VIVTEVYAPHEPSWPERARTAVPALAIVSDTTLAAHRMARLRGIGARFHGMGFTIRGSAWRGAWTDDDHGHEAPGMGILWVTILGCPQCLEHEWPGWRITRDGDWEAADGQRVITCATRSALVCRLATAAR
jgi:hypothetical protein